MSIDWVNKQGYRESVVIANGGVSAGGRFLLTSEALRIINGTSNSFTLLRVSEGYRVGCKFFPTSIVNAVCKELGVARPVVK